MNVIEPCCFNKQLNALVERMENPKNGAGGAAHFFGNSDWDADELLHYVAHAVPCGDLTVCLVKPEVKTLQVLRSLMSERRISEEGTGMKYPLVAHLSLITQPKHEGDVLDQRTEIYSQLGEFIEEGRVTVCEDVIGFRCICAANTRRHWVIQGSLNQNHNFALQMFTMTTSEANYREAMDMMDMKVRTKSIYKKKKE